MVMDLFTKPLAHIIFHEHVARMGVVSKDVF